VSGSSRTIPAGAFPHAFKSTTSPGQHFDVIASLDILGGNVVRLTNGDFATARVYGEPEAILDSLRVPAGSRLHVVDLEGSRSGRPIETAIVRSLASRDLRLQVGGGVRTIAGARTWIDAGAAKVVIGTVAADSPDILRAIVRDLGAGRVIAAVDVRDGIVRVAGWERDSTASLAEVIGAIEEQGIEEILITDIAHDGALRGPSFGLYRSLTGAGHVRTKARLIASGGVSTISDVQSLARIEGVGACVIGKALLEGRIAMIEALERVRRPNAIPERIIPCLDLKDGRVVKGVNFVALRDAGDPVECARRYEEEGADELVILDISATDSGRATSLETVRRVAGNLFIPLTVGGGVRTIDDFRALLRAGADRVAINTAALRRPELISECAREFGVQAVVLSCDAKGRQVMVRSGKEESGIDAVEWCRRAETLGAGEILLTSVDRDGTQQGFDIELLRAVSSSVKIGVIASGGAGCVEHFLEAIESGGARAVLAASLFHDGILTVGDVKRFLQQEGIPVR
jgi:cyclase